MFHRILYEDWQLVFPVVALAFGFAFFGVMCWRAVRMKREQVDHFSRLPLETEDSKSE